MRKRPTERRTRGRAANISDLDELSGEVTLGIVVLKLVLGGCSTAKIRRLMKQGVLPHPHRDCQGMSVWRLQDIRDAITKCPRAFQTEPVRRAPE